ncbi:hypothetical protein KC338_g1118 [Hortaea werneckii]|nr:hypothetical protein KC338_g1118 [Hortaea werneckii]
MPSRSSESRDRSTGDHRSAPHDFETTRPTPSKANSKDKTREKTFMDQWVEPAIATKPSYEDHHGAPYGVLEHMQPLGEAPSAKVKGRVKTEGPRKSTLGRSAAAGGLEGAQETPEGTPAPPPEPALATNGSTQPPVVMDDEKDADYAPVRKRKEGKVGRPRKEKQPSDSAPAKARKSKTPRQSQSQTPVEPSTGRKRVYTPDKLMRVVQSAKERAIQVEKPDLAAAVEEIWRESLNSERLTDLLEAILLQKASKEQTREFQEFVKAAKRRLKDAKEKPRDQPAEDANGARELPLRSPSKTTAALANESQPSALPSTEPTEAPKSKLKLKVKSPQKDLKNRQGGNMSGSTPKKRSDGYDSDSSELTDLTEGEHDEDPMDIDAQDELGHGPEGPAERVNGIKVKDQAAERGSLAAPDRKLKRSSAEADIEDDAKARAVAAKKQKLAETVNRDYPHEESAIRGRPTQLGRPPRGSKVVPAPMKLEPTAVGRISSARGSRAPSGGPESPLTDLSMPSRGATPQLAQHIPKVKIPGKKAKTKTSPEKKHSHGYSGLSGAGGAGQESPIGDDDNEELSENNDFCSACGGSGFLLCCDGCDRAFHFACLDPPLNEEASELNEPWYCYICIAKRPVAAEQPEKPARGIFAPLLGSLKKRNPSNFMLPEELRERDQYVHTGKDGSFTESVNPRTRNRAGYDEVPDYYKYKDSKGNAVLCYFCGKSSIGHRPIIQCDFCNESWHLDCLDPPLANPPARTIEGKKIHDWMCPLHIDHELRQIDVGMLAPRRKVHLRRPKQAKIVEPALSRGFRNNGVVDIAEDESEDSGSEFFDDETAEEGVVYRMPASGIKLDFIDKIKNTRIQEMRSERATKRARLMATAPSALQQANFARRSFVEKQLALNLAQFAAANKDLDLGKDQVENLVGTLIAEAPEEVVNGIMASEDTEKATSTSTAIPPSPPASEQTDQLSPEQRKELQLLQELIQRKLDGSKT